MAKIFISYRRDDSQWQTDLLHDALKEYVQDGESDIFIDKDSIPFGVDFAAEIASKVHQCAVLLAVIGPGWLTARDPETGTQRLEDPDDFVRIEIEAALDRGIPVVPVLFDGARIPDPDTLPASLRALSRRNAAVIRRESFRHDVERLVSGLPISREELDPGSAETSSQATLVAAAQFAELMPKSMRLVSGLTIGFALLVLLLVWVNAGNETHQSAAVGDLELSAAFHEESGAPPVSDAQTFRDKLSNGKDGPLMLVIEPGEFNLGSPDTEVGRDADEGPMKTIAFRQPFAVGVFEVTWNEWNVCVERGGCEDNRGSPTNFGIGGNEAWGEGGRPVINVSWNDAVAFTKWISAETGHDYRLLSESEWEFVIRAGGNEPFAWGTEESDACQFANGPDLAAGREFPGWSVLSCEDGYVNTAPVGSFRANDNGVFDLQGNVAEWVQDYYSATYSVTPIDGSAYGDCPECSTRVIRGASWGNYPQDTRSANRARRAPEFRSYMIGFRVARDIK